MRRRFRAGGDPPKAQRRKTAARKSPIAPKAVRPRRSSAAREETKVARLTRDLNESLQRQTATAEVLRIMSSSPGDLQPVFEVMLENAVRICDALGGGIGRWDGSALHNVAVRWAKPAFVELLLRTPIHPNPKTNVGRMLVTKTVVHVPDLRPSRRTLSKANRESLQPLRLGRYGRFLRPDAEGERVSRCCSPGP